MAFRRPWFICTEVVERATDWMDEALPAGDRLRFRLHLSHCADCRRFVEQVRDTAETCRRLGDFPPASASPELPPRLREGFRELRRRAKEET